MNSLRPIAIAAAAVALESYDLAVYGLFAGALAQLFFPSHDPTSALLLAVGTLGVGYVVRPIGGVLLAYADRAGRKAAIALTVLLLSISTGIIGLLPTPCGDRRRGAGLVGGGRVWRKALRRAARPPVRSPICSKRHRAAGAAFSPASSRRVRSVRCCSRPRSARW